MTPVRVLLRLRRFLLGVSLLIFLGTLTELWLVNHTEDAIQWVPFVLCGLSIVAIIVTAIKRARPTTLFLRACMVLAIIGSALGIYQHVTNNIAFEKEIHPNGGGRELIMKGLSGANPLLAPGMLAIAGLLALAATYKQSITERLDDADVLT